MISMQKVLSEFEIRDRNQPEYLEELRNCISIFEHYKEKISFNDIENTLLDFLEPDDLISFKIPWKNDRFEPQISRGFLVVMNAISNTTLTPIRFHSSLTFSILKSAVLKQAFLTTLLDKPAGSSLISADFEFKGRSESEITSFCTGLAKQLLRFTQTRNYICLPDHGVTSYEIDLFNKIFSEHNNTNCIFTGKSPLNHGLKNRIELINSFYANFSKNLFSNGESNKLVSAAIEGSDIKSFMLAKGMINSSINLISIIGEDFYIENINGFTIDQLNKINKHLNFKRKDISTLKGIIGEECKIDIKNNIKEIDLLYIINSNQTTNELIEKFKIKNIFNLTTSDLSHSNAIIDDHIPLFKLANLYIAQLESEHQEDDHDHMIISLGIAKETANRLNLFIKKYNIPTLNEAIYLYGIIFLSNLTKEQK